MTTLVGARLLLREFRIDDWPADHEYSVRSEVTRYQPWGPNTPEESRAFVEQAVAASQAVPRLHYHLVIALVGSNQHISRQLAEITAGPGFSSTSSRSTAMNS